MRRLAFAALFLGACGFPSLPSLDKDAAPDTNHPPVAVDDSKTIPENAAATIDVLANDSDPDSGDTLTISDVGTASHGSAAISGTSITYTPTTDFVGDDTFTYTIDDGHSATATGNVAITVTADHSPVANDVAVSGTEDTASTIDVLAQDSDPDPADTLMISDVGTPANGTAVITAGKIVYTPAANYNGSDTFTYTITDNILTATANVNITLAPVNDPPVAVDDNVSTPEDTAATFNVLGNDTDVDANTTLTINSVSAPSHGTASISGTQIAYTPDANFNGTDNFTYTITDGSAFTSTATVHVTVTSVNDPPVAADDSLIVNVNTATVASVLGNDSDVDGDTLTVSAVTQPTHGATTITNGNTTVTYTPTNNYLGTDSFTYTVSDGHGGTATAMVSVTVRTADNPPVANADSVTTNEDTAATVAVLANDTDPDNDTLAIQSHTTPTHGTATTSGTSIIYTPNANFNGTDSFQYTVTDGLLTSSATVSITITPVNDAPVAADDTLTTNEDTAGTVNVLSNDTDVDGDTLSISGHSAPGHGTASVSGSNITYTPSANYNGTDTFTYTVSDGHGGTAIGNVSVTINPVNDAPTAVNDSATTPEDTAKTVAVLANDSDIDGDTITLSSCATPSHGSTTKSGSNCIYTPSANYNGSDSFTYTISDGSLTATATVTMTITPVEDPPVAMNDSATTNEDTAKTINVLANDSDPDTGDTLTIQSVTTPGHGTAVIQTGQVLYTPAANYHGADSFNYTITDGTLTATATVSMTVTSVNDAPVASAATVSASTGEPIQITLGATDVDNDPLTFAIVAQPAHGTVSLTGNVATYTANLHYAGTSDSFTFKANDGTVDSNTATITINIVADPVISTSLGEQYGCAVRQSGARFCWGVNGGNHVLGDNTTATSFVPELVDGGWSRLTAGQYHACGIKSDGSLWCWGFGGQGEVGDGTVNGGQPVPEKIGTATWLSVSAGAYHTCGVQTNGTLWCWGWNIEGEIGINGAQQYLAPTQVGTATTWASVGVGDFHSCAIQTTGTLWCWGNNNEGEVGNGTFTQQPTPVQIGLSANWAQVSGGQSHTCAVNTQHQLFCWGANNNGELGDGSGNTKTSPTQVGNQQLWRQVSAGTMYTCATRTDSTLWCWGYDDFLQLGYNAPLAQGSLSPQQVGTATSWSVVDTGSTSTCAVSTVNMGTLMCWGQNAQGATGLGIGDSMVPMPVSFTSFTPTTIAGGDAHTCATNSVGAMQCWGNDTSGQLGDNGSGAQQIPIATASGNSWVSMSGGGSHTCAINSTNQLWCWGDNSSGELGDGTTTGEFVPEHIGTVTWRQVSAGNGDTCAIRSDGTLWCWGSGIFGELGTGNGANFNVPTQVGTSTQWKSVSAGVFHTCGIQTNGPNQTLWCWGSDSQGELGDGGTTEKDAPEQIGTAINWASVAPGQNFTCGIQTNGTLWCWGDNGVGQLGDGTLTQQLTPEHIGTATNWSVLDASTYHTCGIQTGGSLWCWGYNQYGQIGNGTSTNRLTPVQIGSTNTWTAVGVGGSHSCAISTTGTFCWGSNNPGQLGDNQAWGQTPTQNLP